jgi:DNA repair ATPase RecN
LHSDDTELLLGSSHIHSGTSASDSNSTLSLSNKFYEIHDGLYYVDVVLDKENTYIIHAIAFYRGYLSHDSKVISASASSINSIQDSVNHLSQNLNRTNTELDILENRLDQTQNTLNDTRSSITDSLNEARDSIKNDLGEAKNAVKNMEDASGQVNGIILPVLALISVIIALQISLFARIRASYK